MPTAPRAGLSRIWRDFGATYAANGFIGWLFAVTAPVAIILSVGSRGGLSEAEIASWIFGALVGNGVLSILFSTVYRMPLVFFWTIPGTVLGIGVLITDHNVRETLDIVDRACIIANHVDLG